MLVMWLVWFRRVLFLFSLCLVLSWLVMFLVMLMKLVGLFCGVSSGCVCVYIWCGFVLFGCCMW